MRCRSLLLVVAALIGSGCGSRGHPTPPASATEARIVFSRQASSGQSEIWIANGNGGEQRRITTDGGGPSLSPDGRWITFHRTCRDAVDHCLDLYLVSVENGDARLLAHAVEAPAWSPDSSLLVARAMSSLS